MAILNRAVKVGILEPCAHLTCALGHALHSKAQRQRGGAGVTQRRRWCGDVCKDRRPMLFPDVDRQCAPAVRRAILGDHDEGIVG